MTIDVKDFLLATKWEAGQKVDLTGWLVDKDTGLCLLGDHSPENYYYDQEVQISNSDIIYAILKVIPSLGGGLSLLFYKARVLGYIERPGNIRAEEIYVQADRSRDELLKIDISDEVVAAMVKAHGSYKFTRPLGPFHDWLDDVG